MWTRRVEIRTIFLGSDGDGLGGRPITDDGAGQKPNAILGPFLELLQFELGAALQWTFEHHFDGLLVGPCGFDVVQLVVRYVPVLFVHGRRAPHNAHRAAVLRLGSNVLRRRCRNCAFRFTQFSFRFVSFRLFFYCRGVGLRRDWDGFGL